MKTVSDFFRQNSKVLLCWFNSERDFIYMCQKEAEDGMSEQSVLKAAKILLSKLIQP